MLKEQQELRLTTRTRDNIEAPPGSILLNEQMSLHFKQYCEQYKTSDSKLALENFLRRELFNIYDRSTSFTAIEEYLEYSFKLADELKVENNVPFLLIEDVVEVASFETLSQLLPYLDRKASEWCSKLSSKKGNGLILLRTVNLMRRRIIRSEHSKLAGLALLLLSKIFPVNERSGLNLKGERNVENCNLKLVVESSKNEHALFWKLHELMYSSHHSVNDLFVPMQKSISFILETIENVLKSESNDDQFLGVSFFSPQYLTEPDHFYKQITDVNFRLSVLTQILIALQDLSIRSSAEFSKSSKPELILDDNQNEWINDSIKKAFLLVSQHPYGRDHFHFLRHVIRSERNWIKWKSLSCPDFDKDSVAHHFESTALDNFQFKAPVDLGSDELKRLWRYDSSSVSERHLRPDASEYVKRYVDDDFDESSLSSNVKWRIERLKWKGRF